MSSSEIKGVCLKNQSDIKVINQDIQNINVDVSNKIDISEIGVTVCPLDGTTKIDKVYLPQLQASEIENLPNGNITSVDVQGAIDELDVNKIESSLIGSANGVCPLDASSKIDIQYLSGNVLVFKGLWDASTNTPTLSNGTGSNGDVYICQIGGTVDFGAGNITFDPKDWVIYSDNVWNKVDNNDAITSVFGRVGDVVAQASDYNAGQIDYTGVLGANVQDALNQIDAITEKTANKNQPNGYCGLDGAGLVPAGNLPVTGGVTSFNGRTGAVIPVANDYDGLQVSYAGTLGATDVSTALEELNAQKAPLQDPVFSNSITLGNTNTITGADSVAISGQNATVGGDNCLVAGTSVASNIAGNGCIALGNNMNLAGDRNYAMGARATVTDATSVENVLLGNNSRVLGANCTRNFVAGGLSNTVNSGNDSFLFGFNNQQDGSLNISMGENLNVNSTRSITLGYNCTNRGAFTNVCIGVGCNIPNGPRRGCLVCHDQLPPDPAHSPATNDSCTLVYQGGFRLFSSQNNGVSLPNNTTTWTSISDRDKKQDFKPVNTTDILNKIHNMDINYWRYKSKPRDEEGNEIEYENGDYHIGCVAQDFHSAFHNIDGVCTLYGDDKTINSGNLVGVLMASVKELKTQLDSLKSRVAELEAGSA